MSKRGRGTTSQNPLYKRHYKKQRAPRGPSGMPKPIPRSAAPPVNARTGGLLGIELKFYDTSYSGIFTAPTDSAGGEMDPATVLALSAPAQGDGASERIGRHIAAHSISIEGVVGNPNATAATVPRVCFIALVLDTQTNAAQLKSEDVYVNALADGSTAVCPSRNLSERQRFRILAVKRVHISAMPYYTGAANHTVFAERYFRFYRKLNGMDINFKQGGTGGVANVTDRSVHILGFASSVASSAPTLKYNSRFRYTG